MKHVCLSLLVCMMAQAVALQAAHGRDRNRGVREKNPFGNGACRYHETGMASWYGPGFHGRKTASGETYNRHEMSAAHKKLPLGSRARVTNVENNMTVEVRINDRGPQAARRAIDVSEEAAKRLNLKKKGTARVRIQAVPDNATEGAGLNMHH